jgi:hypothetical protein
MPRSPVYGIGWALTVACILLVVVWLAYLALFLSCELRWGWACRP